MSLSLTVFIPAYNEQANLRRCVEVVSARLRALGVDAELLIVDDGSTDGTRQLAERLASELPQVRWIAHSRNCGIGAAFVTAISQARGEWLILIPADLALHPDELSRYIEAAPEADIVVGLRSDRSDYTLLRRLVSYTNIFLIRSLFRMPLRQYQYISMYRLEVLRSMEIECWRSAFFLAEVLIKARDMGRRLVEVEIRYAPRLTGRPSGARLRLVCLTIWEMALFWLRWTSRRSSDPPA